MRKIRGKLNTAVSLLLAAVLCVQYLPVAVTAEAAERQTPYIIIDENTVPDTGYFGDGSDGALYISAGQTVTLPVPIPHQSIVQKNYTSITIEYGGTLRCAAPNAGLILRVQGDVKIYGTIDQSSMAPVTNSNNLYTYPPEVVCGSGGNGGDNLGPSADKKPIGGIGMPSRKYGGGYGGGGSGGSGERRRSHTIGGNGGNADAMTILTSTPLFKGGAPSPPNSARAIGMPGSSAGGGSGGKNDERDIPNVGNSGAGGNAPGANGQDANTPNHLIHTMAGGGGGAGNMGGGIVMLYAGGTITISSSGLIDCSGGKGGNGGQGGNWSCTGNDEIYYGSGGTGGGGGGGGSVYIRHGKAFEGITQINVSGGIGGTGGNVRFIWHEDGLTSEHTPSPAGEAGTAGKISVSKAPDTIPPVISGVTVSTAWGLTNSATVTATDNMSGVVSYAVTNSSSVPSSGSWQSSNSFTLSSNGTYYAFTRDNMGNTTAGYPFTVSKVDTAIPVVTTAIVTPTGWTSGNKTITVTATDSQSGIAEYGITTANTQPTSWQSGNTFSKPVGTYYVWTKDKVGRVSASKQAMVGSIDTVAPVVTTATVTPTSWTSGNKTITVTATDSQSGIAEYGITTTNTQPSTWQSGNTFSKPTGTYYVWARDKVGNVSASKQAVVDSIDTIAPVVTATITPTGWTSGNKTITVTATDSQSGIAEYGITTANTQPSTWQSGNTFNKPTGTYYVWARDKVGNVSASKQAVVDSIDTVDPVVTAATVTPTGWTSGNKTITVTATDSQSGIAEYGITTINTQPNTWQSGNTFSKPAGTYYVWARDKVGNVSASKQMAVDSIDTVAPVVTAATVTPTGWTSGNKTITVTATDSQSGVAEYGITTTNTQPTSWQTGNTFSKAAGTYYVWARDNVGNVSASKQAVVDSIDTVAPVVTAATVTPPGWTSGNKTITVTATDNQSGITEYGITTTNTQPSTWQSGNTFSKPTGTYYVWARDNVGNVSAYRQVIVENLDDVKPVISGVTLPDNWGQSNTATVSASDVGSGVNIYAVSDVSTVPGDGWQSDRSFTITRNGTYYAWCKDKAGNASSMFSFEVNKVDTEVPVIILAEVTPVGWSESGVKTITVTATDSQSGIASYGISATATSSISWRDDNTFSKPLGSYCLWAKDNVGRISAYRQVVVENLDDVKPVISGVTLPVNWGQSNTATINASDVGNGLKEYAVSTENRVPVDGWQNGRSFTLDQNGTYYAWARDKADNISDVFSFEASWVDTEAPVIGSAEVSPVGWTGGSTKTITVTATDAQSGVAQYGITATDTAPTSWQTGNTFVKPAGAYYVWVKDKSGRLSAPVQAVVDGIDTDKPIVTGIKITPGWSTGTVVELEASDVGSELKEYAVSEYRFAPSIGWQQSASFTINKNGSYYAFARDNVGNASEAFPFELNEVDTAKPTVNRIIIAPGFSSCVMAELEASDIGSGVKDYAVADSSAPPTDGWQNSNSFTIERNGSYYAFARDRVDNISVGRHFNITRVDKLPPSIASIGYSADNGTIMIRGKDNESSVICIYIDGVAYPGSTVSWDIPTGTRYIKLQVEDEAGNRSNEETHRVRGWFDMLDSITIEPVEFRDDNRKAVVTGKTTGDSEIAGIYINGRLQSGNPVTYMVSSGLEYLELQAQDAVGDRSELYRVRVPGWSQEIAALSIVDVRFAQDSSTAQVIAMSTGGVEVRGIRVNGELCEGNPVTYEIPTGTTHLKLQAEDMNGDRSASLIRRVPGWSEVVTTLTVTDVTFTDYNTNAQITATATGGDSVAGIIVNEKAYEGNPIVYVVQKGTETLHIQAYNPQGDKSPMLNKPVPMDSSKSTLKLSIEHPEWTKGRSVRVKLTAEDKNRITKLLVRTGEDSEWADVTEKRYIDITSDTTVYATVENDKGEVKEVSQDIDCFDRTAPTVTATQDGKTVNIRASDNKSGVTSILVNNKEYQRGDFEDGKLAYRIPEGTTMVIIKAEDAAGNLSRAVELPIQNTVAALPMIVAPTPAPTPSAEVLSEEAAIPENEALPTPEPETEVSKPEQTVTETATQPEPLPPGARAAVAAGGIGTTTAGGVWYWLRKKALSKPIEELELMGKKLLYDESEFGGSEDPLDKEKGEDIG